MLRQLTLPFRIKRKLSRIEKKFTKTINKYKGTEYQVIKDVKLTKQILTTLIKIIKYLIKNYDKLDIKKYIQAIIDYKEEFRTALSLKTNIYFKGGEIIDMILEELISIKENPSKGELIILEERLIREREEIWLTIFRFFLSKIN